MDTVIVDEKVKAKEKAGHLFQAMDRVHVIEGTFDKYVYESKEIQSSPELLAKAVKISEMLAEFYQDLGQHWNEAEEVAEGK